MQFDLESIKNLLGKVVFEECGSMEIIDISQEGWFHLLAEGHQSKRRFRRACFKQCEFIAEYLTLEGWNIHHIFGYFEYEEDSGATFFHYTTESEGLPYTQWEGY